MIKEETLSRVIFLQSKTNAERKKLGQFFTDDCIAEYMASMIQPLQSSKINILDAGAGTGILTIATALRCLDMGIKKIHAVLYEVDSFVIPYLKRNMLQLTEHLSKNRLSFTFEVREEDFVLSRLDKKNQNFDLSVINPPYFKYNSKNSPYAGKTEDLFKGNPNIYASFMAIVASCLKPNGQMIAIVPRSYKNGLYFKGFRQYLNQNLSLDKVHVFKSRNTVFKSESVLQENVICSYIKSKQQKHIEICSSTGQENLYNNFSNKYLATLLIDYSNSHQIIRIPETSVDAEILGIAEKWDSNFDENGYFISTGPVVEHRTRKYITSADDCLNSVPLLRMHNLKNYIVTWSGRHKKDVRFKLLNDYKKHISINSPYLLLKRFSSKDEKRRLIAAVYNPELINSEYIAIENHINYIGAKDSRLEISEIYGLAALFNSTFMDRYFRCISGSTQVNATEIRLIKMPKKSFIKEIGNSIKNIVDINQQHIDMIVNQTLGLQEIDKL